MKSKTVPDTDPPSRFVRAPFTAKQVDCLNRWQRGDNQKVLGDWPGATHEFTCGNYHDGDRTLFATRKGWICAHCDYTQDWAHPFMAKEITA